MIRTRRALAGIPRYVPGRSAESVVAEHELAEALAARHGVGPDQVLVGNGSVRLCQHLLFTTIEPGDEAVFG